jgi:hypothetical protein
MAEQLDLGFKSHDFGQVVGLSWGVSGLFKQGSGVRHLTMWVAVHRLPLLANEVVPDTAMP